MSIPAGYRQLDSAYFTDFGCLNTGIYNLNATGDVVIPHRVEIDARRDNFRVATLELGNFIGPTIWGTNNRVISTAVICSLYAAPDLDSRNYPQRKEITLTYEGYQIGDSFTFTTSAGDRIIAFSLLPGTSGGDNQALVYKKVGDNYAIYDSSDNVVGNINTDGTLATVPSLPFSSPFRVIYRQAKEGLLVNIGTRVCPGQSSSSYTQGSCTGSYQSWYKDTSLNLPEDDSLGNPTYNSWESATSALTYPFNYKLVLDNRLKQYSFTVGGTTYTYNTQSQETPRAAQGGRPYLVIGKLGHQATGSGGTRDFWYGYPYTYYGGNVTSLPWYTSQLYFFNCPLVDGAAGTPLSDTDSIKRIKIYEQSGETDILVKDYVPVIEEATGIISFFDLVNDELATTSTAVAPDGQTHTGSLKSYDINPKGISCYKAKVKSGNSLISSKKAYVLYQDGATKTLIPIYKYKIKEEEE